MFFALIFSLLSLSFGYHLIPSTAITQSRSKTSLDLFGLPEAPKNPPPKKEGGGGIFGGLGNAMDSMKKMQEIAKAAEQMNRELVETIVTASDPSGQAAPLFIYVK